MLVGSFRHSSCHTTPRRRLVVTDILEVQSHGVRCAFTLTGLRDYNIQERIHRNFRRATKENTESQKYMLIMGRRRKVDVAMMQNVLWIRGFRTKLHNHKGIMDCCIDHG